jgi:hypothetical protein
MFAEDVGLLPKDGFRGLLESLRASPEGFVPKLATLFAEMRSGADFSVILNRRLLRFNGGLFDDADVLALDAAQLGILHKASTMQWKDVEPAIFGTLLERALDPAERHQLGAHYTPRAYVERLVIPAVVGPLRSEWESVRAAAVVHANAGRIEDARAEIRQFHDRLCKVTVLDPACGSGNFLYVTLEHLKRLEGEVLDAAVGFGENMLLDLDTHTVDPRQFLGIELNPRAASVAELVLWIGYLQWHFRTRGNSLPAEPVLKKFHNIECRDAVLACDATEPVLDQQGEPVTRWDGRTMKKHPVTGEDVPNENARVPLLRHINPRPADWPKADFIVGNPPFIGTARMRDALGDGYAQTLRKIYPDVPESADFVMFWWHKAALLVREGKAERFGFITTNSLRQTFNRRVVESHLQGSAGFQPALVGILPTRPSPTGEPVGRMPTGAGKDARAPISLAFAIPDHPWVDSADGAAVRIAMTVAVPGQQPGRLAEVVEEIASGEDASTVTLAERTGMIHSNLTVGADVGGAVALQANELLSAEGMKPHGLGFIITHGDAISLGLGRISGLENHVRPYCNGRDITGASREVMAIDLQGLTSEEVCSRFPEVYQWVLNRVKPERDQNNEPYRRENWWLFGRKHTELRAAIAGLQRYIVTVKTAKHRVFTFLDAVTLPDSKLIVFALDDAYYLGVLSSHVHCIWVSATQAFLEDRPTYVKSASFEKFPFPDATESQRARIRELAESLDGHRKRQQALHPKLTLTDCYNVLEKLRAGTTLSAKEQLTHENGLISVLRQLHDELDAAVTDAYGWTGSAGFQPALVGILPTRPSPTGEPVGRMPTGAGKDARAPVENKHAPDDQEILARLVALNAERAAEEAAGRIRWLRPDYQMRNAKCEAGNDRKPPDLPAARPKSKIRNQKLPWPRPLSERVQAVEAALTSATPGTPSELAKRFSRAKESDVAEILETLATLGRIAKSGDGYTKPEWR